MDWLSSEWAALDALWSCPWEISCGRVLFIRSLREPKLSDCGSFRIKGFWERKRSRFQVQLVDFSQHWLTLEVNVLSTLGLFSFSPGSSSIMALERSLLVGESRLLLWFGSTRLSSDLLVNLSSKLVFFSEECLLARFCTVKVSSLQETGTFMTVVDSTFYSFSDFITFLFSLELPRCLVKVVHC